MRWWPPPAPIGPSAPARDRAGRSHPLPPEPPWWPGRAVTGRVAVITGASRGLGAGLAVHFAGAGVHLGLCALHRPVLVARTRPTAHDGQVDAATPLLAAVDVTDRHALERFAADVVDRFGRIDLWVNNAGLLGPVAPLVRADPAHAARTIEVDVVGVLHGSAVFAAPRAGPGRGRRPDQRVVGCGQHTV